MSVRYVTSRGPYNGCICTCAATLNAEMRAMLSVLKAAAALILPLRNRRCPMQELHENIISLSPGECTPALIERCEDEYRTRLDRTASLICERVRGGSSPQLITLSGPSCSGKTTTVEKLRTDLAACGLRVFRVSIDDFFLTSEVSSDVSAYSEANGELDLDSEDAMDIPEFERFTGAVLSRESAALPQFDFNLQRRSGFRPVESSEFDVFIFEGIQASYPAVRRVLSPASPLFIFTDAASGVRIGDTEFSTRRLRLMRRLLRDRLFRSASVEFTLQVWAGVVRNEQSSIYPARRYADALIDSSLAYEVCVLKEPLIELLGAVSTDFPLYSEVRGLLDDLSAVPSLSPSAVPADSMLREFIGDMQ